MRQSLVICTHNRSDKLVNCLKFVEGVRYGAELEIVLIDNNSADRTSSVIKEFASTSRHRVVHEFCGKRGLSRARNLGIEASSGEYIVFTDDDCYISSDFFAQLDRSAVLHDFDFGTGQIILYDKRDDIRCANHEFDDDQEIPPHSLLKAGMVQGANMFFKRSVFESCGVFNEELGAGTDFPCEDIEMASRASMGGFTGRLISKLKVYHDHGRRTGSAEAEDTVRSYDSGRGAYYACLIARGVQDTWGLWSSEATPTKGEALGKGTLERTSREMFAAAAYLNRLAAKSQQ